MSKLSHTDDDGRARMVDVGNKDITMREATAQVEVFLNDEAFTAVLENKSKKGDVLGVAKVAGIQAAKKTSELIPLCHQIPLDQVEISFLINEDKKMIVIKSTARCSSRTGVEMEALTACSVAALTVYDMLKAVQKDITISNLYLIEKKGGNSGEYVRENT